MSKYTVDDFRRAMFAYNTDGRVAMRTNAPIAPWTVEMRHGPGMSARDDQMVGQGWTPAGPRAITKKEFDKAFNSTVGTTTPAVAIELLSKYGITVIADPKPTNTDRLEQLIRESGYEVFTLGRIADTRELAEWLNTDGVKAPGADDD